MSSTKVIGFMLRQQKPSPGFSGLQWYAGYVYKHPGTKPRGHVEPVFDMRKGQVLQDHELLGACIILREANVAYTIHTVQEVP